MAQIVSNLETAVAGVTINGKPVEVSDTYYPDAMPNYVGTNKLPAIILRDAGDESIDTLSRGNYIVNTIIEIYVYVEANGLTDQTQNINIIKDAILANNQTTFQYQNSGSLFYDSCDVGSRQEGQEDYYTAGNYDTFTCHIMRFTLNYRRCE
jgi:hypothetical protein